jgi:methionyl-tRNA formyltransferase
MSHSPRFAFFGTPDFSVKILDVLDTHGLNPVVVVSAPDKERGRGQRLSATPVKLWAVERRIPVLTPEKLKDNADFLSQLSEYDLDISVVAAYGFIMPDSVLSLPRFGSINVHPSLLPLYRGASPIESQILHDEKRVGVTIMKMDEEMDHGPLLASVSIKLPRDMPDALELEKRLASLGGELLSETMIRYYEGLLTPTEQDHKKATYTKKIKKEDVFIDLSDDPRHNFLKIQAYKRFRPYFFVTKNNKEVRVIITKAFFNSKNHSLIIERVIPEGGKEIPFSKL